MKKIALVIPYFGKLPYNFQLWLEGCKYNSDIDWILFTDDKTKYKYPCNVKVTYCTFENIRERIQDIYNFKILLNRPYKLCDYRVAYGEIFKKELEGYDFWGYCDIDVPFGNIRQFITDEVLDNYEKIGFQGHLTILKNTEEVCERYKIQIDGIKSYNEIFQNEHNCFFDENIFDEIYDALDIQVWKKVNFAHLSKYCPDFYLRHRPKSENSYNRNQIFTWKKGVLKRWYIYNNVVKEEECSYIHFFCRKMDIRLETQENAEHLLIRPNIIEAFDDNKEITVNYIKKKAHCNRLMFKLRYLWRNRSKISVSKLYSSIKMQNSDRKETKE